MISIITGVFNQLPMNQLFWESLVHYTHHPFELIIIDNGSTDDSANFFESVGARVIRNNANYSYPHCQNQGIAVSQYDWLAFLNNDIIVSPAWDQGLINTMQTHGLEVATACGIEKMEDQASARRLRKRWQRIKNLLGLLGHNKKVLRWMHQWMYPDWESFCQQHREKSHQKITLGFVGNTVMMQRSALAKIGQWDERIQGADYDLFLRTDKRATEVGDIQPMHCCLDTFVHHYIRLTSKSFYPPFVDQNNLLTIKQKWTEKELQALNKIDIDPKKWR